MANTPDETLAIIKDANALLRAEGHPSEIREVLVAEVERLRAIIAARLCEKHASATGLFSYAEDEERTAAGGGCAVCIGMRLEAENDSLRAILVGTQPEPSCRDGHTLVWSGSAAGYFSGAPPPWAKCSRCGRTYEAITQEPERTTAA